MGLFPQFEDVFNYIVVWNFVALAVHFAVAIYVMIEVGLVGVWHPIRANVGTQRWSTIHGKHPL